MRSKSAEKRKESQGDLALDPRTNSAVRELLDHIARELAEEYVRLMKAAAEGGGQLMVAEEKEEYR